MSKQGKHKTVAKDLKQSIKWLESFYENEKVIIGLSESCKHRYAPGHIKVKSEIAGGITLNGYTGKGVTNIYIRINPIEKVPDIVNVIKNRFP